MRLFKITSLVYLFLISPHLIIAQISVKEDNLTITYLDNKIGIQFENPKSALLNVKAYNVSLNSAIAIEKDSAVSYTYVLKNIAPAQIVKMEYQFFDGKSTLTQVKYLASKSLSTGEIKVYFNHAVDNSFSQTQNAVNLSNALADKLIEYINACTATLDIAIYNSYSPSAATGIAGAINAAYARGVQVRIVYDGGTSSAMIPLINPVINRLASPKGSSYGIMHNKFVICDADSTDPNRPWVWTGSTNWTALQIDGPDQNNAIAIQDQSLALAYKIEFEEMWGSNNNIPDTAVSKFGPYKTDNTPHTFVIGGKTVESYFSPSDDTNTKIISAINSANSDIDIATMLITRTDITTALSEKFNSGMTNINLVADTQNPSGNQFLSIQSGLAENHVVKSNFSGIMHHKFMVVDNFDTSSDPQVLLGSHNWSSSAQTKNDENTLIVHDANIANQYYQAFAYLYQQAGGIIASSLAINNNLFAQSGLFISPNPSTGIITIENSSDNPLENSTLKIVDILGKIVFTKKYGSLTKETIDISDKANGMYFIQLQNQNQFKNYKILKQ